MVGGLGLIGLEVTRALSDSGAKVVVIDIKPINKKLNIYLKRNNLQYYKIKNKVDKYFDKEIDKIFKKFNTPIYLLTVLTQKQTNGKIIHLKNKI